MRYSRQSKFFENYRDFSDVNIDKIQDSFKNKNIVIVGCGGIGSVFSELLVRGGFLNLTLVDNDLIDETNLQRQTYLENDIGKSKSQTLAESLIKIDSKVKVKIINSILVEQNIEEIFKKTDLIIDATDNFETRRLINGYCEQNNKNWLYTGAVRSEAICCLFRGKDKLFSKVFPKNIKNESCCDVGILSSTTYIAASLGYNQILKYLLGIENKETRLIKLDLWTNKLFEVKIK